jgi:hypothetical protein
MQEPTTGLPLGDRMYNYRKYHYCFLAADGVDWVLKYSGIPQMHSRLNAVIVFQLLMDKYVARERLNYELVFSFTFLLGRSFITSNTAVRTSLMALTSMPFRSNFHEIRGLYYFGLIGAVH